MGKITTKKSKINKYLLGNELDSEEEYKRGRGLALGAYDFIRKIRHIPKW